MVSLAGFELVVHGSFPDLPRDRLSALVGRRGGRLATRISPRTTHLVIAHGSAGRRFPDWPGSAAPQLLSEGAFRRLMGLAPPPMPEPRSFTLAEVASHAKLDPIEAEYLSLFDVLEDVDGHFSFRDVSCAREVARLLGEGVDLDAIIHAALALRRSGRRLASTRLVRAPWGGLVHETGGRLLSLDGQFTLDLGDAMPDREEILENAAEAAEDDDLAEAERLYAIALRMDPADPIAAFNLASIRHARGDAPGAMLAYRLALARDPTFADAWYNLGVLHAASDRMDEAEYFYRGAVDTDPEHGDALHNLALLLSRADRHAEALPRWEALARLEMEPSDRRMVQRHVLLCRMAIAGAQPVPSPA